MSRLLKDALAFELDGRPNFFAANASTVASDGGATLSVPGRAFPYLTQAYDTVSQSDNVAAIQFERHEEAVTFTSAVWASQ